MEGWTQLGRHDRRGIVVGALLGKGLRDEDGRIPVHRLDRGHGEVAGRGQSAEPEDDGHVGETAVMYASPPISLGQGPIQARLWCEVSALECPGHVQPGLVS